MEPKSCALHNHFFFLVHIIIFKEKISLWCWPPKKMSVFRNKSFLQTGMNRIISIPNTSNSPYCLYNESHSSSYGKKKEEQKNATNKNGHKNKKQPILYFKIIALSRKLHCWKMLPCEIKVRSLCFQLQWLNFSWIQTCMHW